MSLLSPYRVLDLTDDRGNLAGLILAQLGAEVIAIEPPDGSRARHQGPFAAAGAGLERSLVHWSFNRGKRSVVLDLEGSSGDRTTFHQLAEGADILLENGAPGELASIGLGYHDLSVLNPALVYASMTPFGQDGPKRDWAGSDLIGLAAGGYVALTGDDDRAPVRLSTPQAWHHVACDAAGAVLIALFDRHRSGLGQHIDLSLQASVLQATQSMVLAAPLGAPKVVRIAGGVKLPPLDIKLIWRCKDGHVTIAFLFGTSIGPFTARLMEWVHAEGFCDAETLAKDWIGFAVQVDEGRETVESFEAVKACVQAFLLTKTKDELLEAALTKRLLIAPITTIADVAGSDQLQARDYWQSVPMAQTGSDVRFNGSMAKLSATPLEPLGPPPRLGEHTAAVLAKPRHHPAAPHPHPADGPTDGPPLAGVKVLDFMWAMAGPATTRVMADYGATVVRVESSRKLEVARGLQPFVGGIAGAENSGLFLNMNAGKLGLAIDLGKPEAREVILDLVRWADVVCESFSPKAMRGWGLDYESMRAVNPSLVMLSSCLMGQTGPLATFAGFGNLAAAISGFHNITGWPDRDPSGPFSAYTDYVSPRFSLAVVLAALDHRRRTGEGQYIDFSQAEATLHLLAPPLLDYHLHGTVLGRHGNRDPDMAPHGVFRCAPRGADTDRWVAIAITDDAVWRTFCDEAGMGHLAQLTTSERQARVDELEGAVEAWTCGQDEDAVAARLQARGVPAHITGNSPELLADPQLAHRGHFVTVDHPVHGPVTIEGTRWLMSRTPPPSYRPAPTLGEHAFEILTELLDYDVDRVADLAAAELLE